MRRWTRWVAKLYPRPWRERYGDEFDALLENVEPDWRQVADVLRGALKMQARNAFWDWKWVAAFAVAGAVAAGVVAFRVPSRYVSTAVMQLRPGPEAEGAWTLNNLAQLQTGILSRGSLAEIVLKPGLDLYKGERARLPMEDVLLQMRNRDIRIHPVGPSSGGPLTAFQIEFAYPDRYIAQAVVRELVAKFTQTNMAHTKQSQQLWQRAWQRSAPAQGTLEVLDPASLPQRPISPNRAAAVAAGLVCGLALGILALLIKRSPRRTVAVAAYSLAGAAIAIALAFLIPDRWVSTAVMRFTVPIAPKEILDQAAIPPPAERLQRMQAEVLSRHMLAAKILKPSLDLYTSERSRRPMEEVEEKMRNRDIMIRPVGDGKGLAFSISFAYSDRFKAQAMVRELVTMFVEQYTAEMRALAQGQSEDFRKMMEYRMGPELEVLDPASLPELPVFPNRLAIGVAGMIVGLVAGALLTRRKKGPPPATAPLGSPAPANP